MKLEFSELATKVACSVAAACFVGGGTMVLNTATKSAENSQRIDQMELRQQKIDATLEKLDENVRSLDKNVAILNERLRDM